VLTEDDPIDPNPPGAMRPALVGILHVERMVPAIEWGEGVVLRYGGFYGPGTAISLAPDAPMAAPIRNGLFPIIGDGGGVWSHVHVDDAVAATAIAVERGEPGVYNIADDEPAPVREWLPVLASALGAKQPRRIPAGWDAGGRRDGDPDDDRGARFLERQGEARTRLAAPISQLAARLRARTRLNDDRQQIATLRGSAFSPTKTLALRRLRV
jgi:nucleoside-diphosphate-sugar epimerase